MEPEEPDPEKERDLSSGPAGGYPPFEADPAPFHGIPMPDAPRTPFAREIAEAIKKRGITREAAQLLAANPAELDEIGATRIALRLLEAQQYALAAFREEENFESGLEKCRQAWQARESVEAAHSSVIPYEYKTDQHGEPLPVPLEKGLSVLMPGLKDREKQLERFLQWLSDTPVWQLRMEIEALERQADDESLEDRKRVAAFGCRLAKQLELSQLSKDPQEFRAQAERKLGEWQGDGIPAYVFEFALRGFNHWWDANLSEVRSVEGKKGRQKQLAQAKKKQKH